jgi:K+-sensing histidine kinase KdpD
VGLGLCISKLIVGKFNGTISFVSKFKEGSSFKFNFDMEEFIKGEKKVSFGQIDSSSKNL